MTMTQLSQKTAFITGITGQDGAYLAAFLKNKNYKIHGLLRWDSYIDPLSGLERLDALGLVDDNITLHYGDITDANATTKLIRDTMPDEIYNLAALSHVKVSFETPASVLDINTKGTLNILDAVRILGTEKTTRIYQASSSEMFGSAPAPQDENTPMHPCSPYGVAKLAAYGLACVYRDSYQMFVANGILFNHESPLRGEDFVTRKITKAVAAIESGKQSTLTLGNLNSIRDWGDARDYVEGMWKILQQNKADDYILATGKAYSVRDFVERAFAHIGIKIKWQGHGLQETGINSKTGKTLITIDANLFRPKEVSHLLGNAQKAQQELGWTPKITMDKLISTMINTDREALWNKTRIQDKSWQQIG